MTSEQPAREWPLAREVYPYVSVTLNPAPCERSFHLFYRANGDLRAIEIDGVYYSARRMKTSLLFHEEDRTVTLVQVRMQLPDA